jgi:hypothetical protein
MDFIVEVEGHQWSHIIDIDKIDGNPDSDKIIVANVYEIQVGEGYLHKGIMNLEVKGDQHVSSMKTNIAVKLEGAKILAIHSPDSSIDKISFNLATQTKGAMKSLLDIYLKNQHNPSEKIFPDPEISFKSSYGYTRARKHFKEANFDYGTITIAQNIPESVKASMRGDLLGKYIEHESIDPRAVITHVVQKGPCLLIDYDVHSVRLLNVFGSPRKYLHLEAGSKVAITYLEE